MRRLVYDSVKSGKSRFGWSWKAEHDLRLDWTEEHTKQLFLLQIRPGDWVVHVNCPEWGECVAAQVDSEYAFDSGLPGGDGGFDFRHFFEVKVETIVEFERRDPNVLPAVNLSPRTRFHRVKAVSEFLSSLQNLRAGKVQLGAGETRQQYHLKQRTDRLLDGIAEDIHVSHGGKDLEHFVAEVIRRIPDTEVLENGSGWRSDHGADLIVTVTPSIAGLELPRTVVVQVKSYTGEHRDTKAVEQVKDAIAHYHANAGMIVTTGKKTNELERAIEAATGDEPISLLAGEDFARFVLRYAPDLLF